MVRWRLCLVLALLVLPMLESNRREDDDEEEQHDESEEDTDDDEDDEEEEEAAVDKSAVNGRRVVPSAAPPTVKLRPATAPTTPVGTEPTRRKPLECFACTFNSKANIKSCLDPAKYRQDRVHTITCTDVNDQCYTTVVSSKDLMEGVIRGCRPNCVPTTETTCCDINRCNSQAFTQPTIKPRAHEHHPVYVPSRAVVEAIKNRSTTIAPNIFVFVSILLLLQTVVKVSFI